MANMRTGARNEVEVAQRSANRFVRWGLAAVLMFALLGVGSLDTGILAIVTGLLIGLVAVSWGFGGALAPKPSATVLFGVAALLVAWTGLQCLPLPVSWIAVLSPHAADIWGHALDPLHVAGPTSATLSLDPVASRIELLRGAAYVLAFLVALRVAHRRDGALFLERTIVVLGVTFAVVTLVHMGLDARKVFGLYAPKTDVSLVAPLLNTNQVGGYLNVALCVALASMLAPEPIAPRPLLALATVLLLGMILWLPSRGAVAGMVGGVVLVTVLTFALRNEAKRGVQLLLPIVVAGTGVTMMVLATTDRLESQLGDIDVSKLGVQWRALRSMAAAYPIFGAGRGAFESTFPEFRSGIGYAVFSHPENVVVQWISEWGVPAAVAGLGAMAWALRPTTLTARTSPPIGAWVALVVLGLHNLVDFSSENPGVVLSLVTCAAVVVAGTDGSSRFATWGKHPRATAGVSVAAATLAIAIALPARGHELVNERLRMTDLVTSESASRDAFFSELRAAILRHPAEPHFTYLGAVWLLTSAPDESVVPWIDRTLERSPVHPPAHLVLARWLRHRSRTQALLEYRLAAEQQAVVVASEAQGIVRTFDDAMELAPGGKAGLDTLEALAAQLRSRLPSTSARIDAVLSLRYPGAPGPSLRAAEDAVTDLRAEDCTPWCESDHSLCVTRALERARVAQRAAPDRCEPFWLEAQVRLIDEPPDVALDGLDVAANQVSDRPHCLRLLAEASISAHRTARATETIEKLANAACASQGPCVDNLVVAAGLELGRGNRWRALVFYKRASEAAPDREDLLLFVAQTASAAGSHSIAAEAWSSLSDRHPNNSEYSSAAVRELEAANGR